MYLYSFNTFAGSDRVFFYQGDHSSFKAGDLIQQKEYFYLCLGAEIAFAEAYQPYPLQGLMEKVYPDFFSEKYLALLHWMVEFWYSKYRKVIPLFVNSDIPALLKRNNKIVEKSGLSSIQIFDKTFPLDPHVQNLIIFPDLWSIKNMLGESALTLGDIFYSLKTQNQKDRIWRDYKLNTTGTLITTGSEIFQNFNNLHHIILIEPHKRYYSSQQDPRYKVQEVAEKMSQIHDAKLEIISNFQSNEKI